VVTLPYHDLHRWVDRLVLKRELPEVHEILDDARPDRLRHDPVLAFKLIYPRFGRQGMVSYLFHVLLDFSPAMLTMLGRKDGRD